jgi:hypothetical protein
MEVKDIFFSIGIVSSFIIGIVTLSLSFKNRRNTLREHLYKEQISFFSKFLLSVNTLNLEIENLINDPSKRKNNDFYEILQKISHEYYNYEFLIPNEISGLINNLIFKSNQFYTTFLGSDEKKTRIAYTAYFDTYSDMLNYIKGFIGTNELSLENKKLHSQGDKKTNNNILKLILEISDYTVRRM